MRSYKDDVFLFGAQVWICRERGVRIHIRHKTTFYRHEVQTDGRGNINKMPLLMNKSCFGRPEAYYRHSVYYFKSYLDQNNVERLQEGRCARCKIYDVCAKIADERVDADPSIREALDAFEVAASTCHGSPFRSWSCVRLWIRFLHAIKSHGGWTNSNDLHVVVEEQRLVKARSEKKREQRKATSTRRRAAYARQPQPITPKGMSTLATERNKREQILLDYRKHSWAPPWIRRLPDAGCKRTADVWMIQELMKRHATKVTSRGIAEYLINKRIDIGTPLASLTSRVNEARQRIIKLEDGRTTPIWPPFVWPSP